MGKHRIETRRRSTHDSADAVACDLGELEECDKASNLGGLIVRLLELLRRFVSLPKLVVDVEPEDNNGETSTR